MNIKKTITIIALSCLVLTINAQTNTEGVSIAPNVVPPHSSAMLDVSSTTKGVLIPRMLEAQKNAIQTPEESLLIYQTDAADGYYYWDGTAWVQLGAGGLWSKIGTTNDIRYAFGKVQVGMGITSTPISEFEVINPGADNLFNFEGSTGYKLNFGLYDAAGAAGAGSFLTQVGGTLSNGLSSVSYTQLFADGQIGLNFRSFHNLGNPFMTINSPSGGMFITSGGGIAFRPFNFPNDVAFFNTNGDFIHSSDSTLKTNVTNLTSVLSNVLNCRPVEYNWLYNSTGQKTCGFIAQEIEAIFPEIVSEHVNPETGVSIKGINYNGLTAILYGAVQEQQTVIQQQQAIIDAMELRLQALEGQ